MEVLICAVSGPTVGHDGLPAYQEHADGPTLQVTVGSSNRRSQPPFEFARLRLQGAIKTQIGSKVSVRKILNLFEECSWSQFAPVQGADGSSEHLHSATIAFNECEKPMSVLSPLPNPPLPSTSISGPAYFTKHTALSDQHLVQGRCETHCWVTADFYSGGAIIQSSRAVVDPLCGPRFFSFSTSKSDGSGLPATSCRPLRPNFGSFRKSRRVQASACVHLPEESLIITPSYTQDDMKCSTISLPLHVSLNQLSQTDINAIHQEGGLPCEIETKWITQRTFKAGSLEGRDPEPAKVAQRTASTQQSRIRFPPVYDAGTRPDNATVSSTGTLQLILPTSAALPTLSLDLLQVSYELEMVYRFRLGSGMILEGKAKTPCILEN